MSSIIFTFFLWIDTFLRKYTRFAVFIFFIALVVMQVVNTASILQYPQPPAQNSVDASQGDIISYHVTVSESSDLSWLLVISGNSITLHDADYLYLEIVFVDNSIIWADLSTTREITPATYLTEQFFIPVYHASENWIDYENRFIDKTNGTIISLNNQKVFSHINAANLTVTRYFDIETGIMTKYIESNQSNANSRLELNFVYKEATVFGLEPYGYKIMAFFWNIGTIFAMVLLVCMVLPKRAIFEKFAFKRSFFDSLYLKTMLSDISETITELQRPDRWRIFELGLYLFIGIVTAVFYHILNLANLTFGVIFFWDLFWIYLLRELILMAIWVGSLVIITTILQNPKLTPVKETRFTVKHLLIVALYIYGTVKFLYFFTSWMMLARQDLNMQSAQFLTYGSLSLEFVTPLFYFVGALWCVVGPIVLMFWLSMLSIIFILNTSRPSLYYSKLRIPRRNIVINLCGVLLWASLICIGEIIILGQSSAISIALDLLGIK